MDQTIVTIAPTVQAKPTLRVAAYCRVSSDSDDQLHSFAAQVQHYTKTISNNERMELTDIYTDEGISGTKTAKRDDFNRLIADCKKGKIDRVLTKSVSRFARNTADALMYARLLKEYGVSILFEKENIDTAYLSSELLLALSSAQAQEETISISKNMRWSIERRMQNGTYLTSSAPYGYEIKNGIFHIKEDEAEVVQKIFRCYLSGMGKKDIADMLNQTGAPKRFGFTSWRINTVDYILSNERYIGDALLQKSFTTDTLPFHRKTNHGEKTKYYVASTNPPIISAEDFVAVQKMIREKRLKREKIIPRALSHKIKCNCGDLYTPITVNGKQYWGCKTHDLDAEKCTSIRILEKDIFDAFITMVNKLRYCRTEILPIAIAQTERLQMKSGGTAERIKEIDRKVAEFNNKNLVLARLNTKGILRPAEYVAQSTEINQKVADLRAERRNLLKEQDEDSILSGLRKLNNQIMQREQPLTDFDEILFQSVVNKITVISNTTLCFELLGGLLLTETITERKRSKI